MIHLAARGIRAEWEASSGHLPTLEIGGASVLHSAPWRDDVDIQSDTSISVVDRRLGGTFACAPFGADDVDAGPAHGLSANARWRVLRSSPQALTAYRKLSRGSVTARIALRDMHPVLYQTHILALDAPCTFAHHPMIYAAEGARLSASVPQSVLTYEAEAPVYRGNERSADWHLATREGGTRDLRELPQQVCEDFVTLVSASSGLGWTAVQRRAEGDTIITLRRIEQLPITMLWLTNGARQARPWDGRFRGVIGIEDGICAAAEGFAAALSGRSRIAAEGVRTALPAGRHVIPHAILRLDRPVDVTEVSLDHGLRIETTDGTIHIPFDEGHFA